jgi:hypothetical protein
MQEVEDNEGKTRHQNELSGKKKKPTSTRKSIVFGKSLQKRAARLTQNQFEVRGQVAPLATCPFIRLYNGKFCS